MDLDALIHGLAVVRTGAPGDGDPKGPGAVRICDITEDSRTVMPGSLFIARRGEKVDGRAFVAQAVAAGAVAVMIEKAGATEPRTPIALGLPPKDARAAILVADDIQLASAQVAERFYGAPSSRLDLIGVTGTNGKTTITFLTHQLLNGSTRAQGGRRCGLIGTVLVDDGVETAPASHTTPPALELSRTLARMVEADCRAAVMEVSSHALDQRRVGALAFKVGVFTNLTHDHLDYHGTMECYAAAKARLFQMLVLADEGGVAVINADDPAAESMVQGTRARVVRCSMRSRRSARDGVPDWRAKMVGGTSRQTEVEVHGPWTTVSGGGGAPWAITLPLIGPHNVMNALQAAAAAHAAGLSLDAVREHLPSVSAPPGRLEPITPVGAPVTVYVDYAHTDDALSRVLHVLKAAKGEGAKLICVFGCGGDRDATKRPKMGKAAATIADRVIVTSDNPRTEDPSKIIDQILAGVPGPQRSKVAVHADREHAIHAAIAEARPGDVVLIAGKGHEDYQIVGDGRGGTIKRHFDDRDVGRAALTAAGTALKGRDGGTALQSRGRGPRKATSGHAAPAKGKPRSKPKGKDA